MSKGDVLVVDDDRRLNAAYARVLTGAGFTATQAYDGREAIQHLDKRRFDAVVSDLAMPQLDGIGLLREVRTRDLDVPVVLVTGAPSVQTAQLAVQYGALRYLCKPVELPELLSVVESAVALGRVARLKRETMLGLGATDKQLGDRASLEVGFERALAGMWMAFQPIVKYSQRRSIAYEALLRSTEPTLPHPGAVLDAAERLGRLPELGRAIRGRVAETVGRSPVAQVFVNLHPHDLLDDELYAPLAPLSLLASKVVFEITERASLEEVKDLQSRIARLRGLGFQLAVDDVGAGYAGLGSIAQLQPEVMKVDMALVRDIDIDSTKQKLVGALVKLCEEMRVLLIAEGVETKPERDALLRLGCDHLQGYLFAKPDRPFPDAKF